MAVTTLSKKDVRYVTFTDDPNASDAGFQLGTLWLNVSSARAFICLDNSAGAAIWQALGGNFLSLTASVALTAPACVALNSSGELIYANAGSTTTSQVIGFIPVDIGEAAEGLVQYSGKFTFTGATFTLLGKPCFLSLTDGQVSEAPPAFGSGRVIRQVGQLLTATDLMINIQEEKVF